jgi:hypothetical protein
MPATLQVVCVLCSRQKVCYAKLRSSSRENIYLSALGWLLDSVQFFFNETKSIC